MQLVFDFGAPSHLKVDVRGPGSIRKAPRLLAVFFNRLRSSSFVGYRRDLKPAHALQQTAGRIVSSGPVSDMRLSNAVFISDSLPRM